MRVVAYAVAGRDGQGSMAIVVADGGRTDDALQMSHGEPHEMLRALIIGLTILHLGPGVAFIAVAFGCDATRPLLGAVCQTSPFATFLGITLAAWAIMVAGTVVVVLLRRSPGYRAADNDVGSPDSG